MGDRRISDEMLENKRNTWQSVFGWYNNKRNICNNSVIFTKDKKRKHKEGVYGFDS